MNNITIMAFILGATLTCCQKQHEQGGGYSVSGDHSTKLTTGTDDSLDVMIKKIVVPRISFQNASGSEVESYFEAIINDYHQQIQEQRIDINVSINLDKNEKISLHEKDITVYRALELIALRRNSRLDFTGGGIEIK